VDVHNDAGGRELLQRLGVRHVPVVARGRQFVLAQNLEDVAEFLGLQGSGHIPLPAAELVRKWITILEAARRYVRQIPSEQMNLNATEARSRSVRVVCHHIFRIGEAHLECAVNGAKNLNDMINEPLDDGAYMNGDEIARYGAGVIARIGRWWNGLDDKSCRQDVELFFGVISLHQLLDRSAWHSAHHTRQIAEVLERQGITPDGRLTREDLAGLPVPDRIWD
jgi:hypothetical protein